MAKIEIIEESGAVSLKGKLTYNSVATIKDRVKAMISKSEELDLRLAEVIYSDSSGIALLLEWMRFAKQHNKKINFVQMPTQMRAIAQVTGLCPILFAGEYG